MKRQRRIIYLAAFVIALLIAINVFSYSAPSEEMMTAPISVEFDPEHVSNLEKLVRELKDLNSMHVAQQQEIQGLRDIVHRLESRLEDQRRTQPPAQSAEKTVVVQSEEDSVHHLSTEEALQMDIGQILSGMDEVKYPEISVSNKFVSDTPSSPNAVLTRDIHGDAVIFEGGSIHGSPLLLDRCMKSLTEHHELDVLSAIAFAHNGFVPWFWSRESIGAALQNKRLNMESEVVAGGDFDNVSSSLFVVADDTVSDLLEKQLLTAQSTVRRIRGGANERMRTECGWVIVQHPVRRFIGGMRLSGCALLECVCVCVCW